MKQKIEGGWDRGIEWRNPPSPRAREIIEKNISDLLASERQRCVEIANQESLMFFKQGITEEEIDRCGRIRKQMRKEIVDKIEQLK